ncbi:MAG: MBL fold metallo-hydrolase [Candidatus Pacebacteria bacterium]|jgi:phosphoribosyl 1,2-cyclic phosphate phosphodiesterase|nr:MBL fold metallo-hydrolase [Candidatus Paceibacterota bacterium]
MKVTILGCGSAYGVPLIGGDWGSCNPDQPRNRRTTPSILVDHNGSRLMVDCGPDFRIQAEKHKIRLLDGILYTHPHADHIAGNFHLPMFMRYYQDCNLPLYAERSCRKDIERVWWFQNDPAINVEYSGPGRPYWVEIIPFYDFKVGNIEVTPLLQYHGRMNSMGYRIGNFAYSTDLNDMPEQSWNSLQDLDVWVIESDSEKPTTMHSHLEKTLGWIEKLKPKKAYITHLDYTMDYDSISRHLPENVFLAYDDLVIEI